MPARQTPRTTAWTELALPFTATLALATGVAGAAASSGSVLVLGAAVVLVTVIGGLAGRLPVLGGTLLGLLGAAGAIGAATLTHVWGTTSAALDLSLAACLVLLGVAASVTGNRAEELLRVERRSAQGVARPVPGTLGTLREADGLAVLEAEMLRARIHGRPLSLALVQLHDLGEDLPADDLARARSAYSRALVAELRETDVPFLTADGELGVVMPESDAGPARDTLSTAFLGAGDVTFAARAHAARLAVTDTYRAELRIASMPPDHGTPSQFLAAARREWPVDAVEMAEQDAGPRGRTA